VAALAELVFTTFVEGYVRMATCVAFARVSFSPLHTDAGVWLHAAALGAPVPSGSVAARGRARGACRVQRLQLSDVDRPSARAGRTTCRSWSRQSSRTSRARGSSGRRVRRAPRPSWCRPCGGA
jgi:hypothetical protein